jgi:hypothetical protein
MLAKMASRNVHFSRLLDIVSGSIFASARNRTEQDRLYKDFDVSKLNDTKFRELVTANLPALYIVKPELIAKEAESAIKNNFNTTVAKAGNSYQGDSDFEVELKKILSSNKIPSELTKIFIKALSSKFKPYKFLVLYKDIDKIYTKMVSSFNVKRGYVGYRNAAATYGNSLRSLMSSKGIFIAEDANSFLEGISTNDVVLVCPTFSSAVRSINETLQAAAETYFTSIGINTSKYDAKKNPKAFTIGSLANAGHTSVKVSGEVLGINTPLTQKTQFLLSDSPLSFEVEKSLSSIPLHVSHAIEFKQNFSGTASKLLDMQFSFVVSQDFKTNNRLSTEELARVKAVVSDVLLPTIKEQALKKLSGGIIDPTEYGASPSFLEHLESAIVASIKGEKVSTLKKTSKASKDITISIPALVNKALTNKLKIKVNSGTSLKLPKLRNLQTGKFTSLASLQSLLNQALIQQVKRNMGKGGRRDILNLRSGRFAESVRVERMSQSREGMITAFYNYMKYPYQTFEPGFKQGRPTSRDPKLLISKSIREIAATMVGNKLRAVRL